MAQKYLTRSGEVRFFSKAPLENIEAMNHQASCIVDTQTGEVVSRILLKAFQFEKALMQEHFNENYVESDKYPQAVLNAKISNLDKIDFTSNKKQAVILDAQFTLKNITRSMSIAGEFVNENGVLITTASFIVKPEEHDIRIPRAVRDNIAREVEVSVSFKLEPFNR
jgi:hypothetical protein